MDYGLDNSIASMLNILIWIIVLDLGKYIPKYQEIKKHDVSNLPSSGSEIFTHIYTYPAEGTLSKQGGVQNSGEPRRG